jgi:hypothetical protein
MAFSDELDFLNSYRAVNQYSAVLASNISATATSVVLVAIGGLSASTKGIISIGNEHIFYNGISTNTLTGCTRGYENSTAVSHLAGEVVEQRVDASIFNSALAAIKDIPKIDLSNSISAVIASDSFTPPYGNVSIRLYGQAGATDDLINIGTANVNDGEIVVLQTMNQITFKNTGNVIADNLSLTEVIAPQYSIVGFYWHFLSSKWRLFFSSIGVVDASTTASNKLENPSVGAFNDGLIQGWLVGTTIYSDAFYDVNLKLKLLTPARPSSLSAFSLSSINGASTRSSINLLLSSGTTDNTTGGAPSAGTQVYRIASASISSNTLSGFGSGNSGTLSAMKNGVVSGQRVCTTGDDTGTYTSLIIVADTNYPLTQTGFWQSLTAKVVSTVSAGTNKFQMKHSEDGNTNETFFVYDDVSNTPAISSITLTENTPGTFVYSSGIAHYNQNATLNVNSVITNLASNCYLASGNIDWLSTSSFGTGITANPGTNGLSAVLVNGMGPLTLTGGIFTIGGTVHTSGTIQIRGRNANADGSYSAASTVVHVMSNTPTPTFALPVQEVNTFISDTMGTTAVGIDLVAKRIYFTGGDTPADSVSTLTASNWVASASLSAHEAKAVGGVLKHSIVNYSSGYLPAGPNYSSHSATQYATFFLRRSAVSNFKISISGTYAGCWVRLEGLTGTPTTSGYNDWWDATKLYAGAGIPNRGGNDNGCANGTVMSGSSGLFQITFGTESSNNAINSIICVRVKLTSGQSITSLAFRE